MITFFTALYSEARELINTLKLKQNPVETQYQLFEAENVHLVITGAGMISAAMAAARHFTQYPPVSGQDIAVNLGIAGYVPVSTPAPDTIGHLFLASKLIEQATGRTFYPDFLYRNDFDRLSLITTPVICKQAADLTAKEALSGPCLVDMEGSALYQAILPHISPERMLFFKVVSDIIPQASLACVSPEDILAKHIPAVLSYVQTLHGFLQSQASKEISYTDREQELIQEVYHRLPMTGTMQNDFERLLRYAVLSHSPLASCLTEFLSALPNEPLRGKKQAMPYLAKLRELILNSVPMSPAVSKTGTGKTDMPETPIEDRGTANITSASPQAYFVQTSCQNNLYQPFFSTVYVEKEVWKEDWKSNYPANPIIISHYKDIFNRSHQNFAAQKKAPSLILAKKTGTLIYKGAPVCQSFGHEHFYYTSCMMNCIYHCDYCYLQGMYPSGHVVVFVNLEDYFSELETLLNKHPVYLCISYDTDLLALEHTFSFVSRWLSFAADHPDLTLEIRTKSGNPAIFKTLAERFDNREHLKEHIIFSWTVSPEAISQSIEHGAASLPLRLKALLAAKEAGFSVRLCFDPMIFHAGWEQSYATLVDTIFTTVSAELLYDVSIGVFRISADYLKNMRKKRPDSAIVQYPYRTENGVAHYGDLSEHMIHYLQELLLLHVPAEKIFVWNEKQ